jgi:hypothetical protein
MHDTREHEPRLSAHDEIFRSGYGPRAIRLSRDDRNTLFVGCKDGSVTKVDLIAAADREAEREKVREAAVRLCGAGTTGVRSLCDLGNGWLLLGQDDGTVSVLPWAKDEVAPDEKQRVPHPIELPHLPENPGAFGYVGRWEGDTFILSPRRADAFLLRFGEGFTPILGATLHGVKAMSGFARLGPQERWIVCKTGALWWQGEEGLEQQDGLWDGCGLERPGFVFDIAVVRSAPDDELDHGIYLSTDEGVFLLRRPAADAPSGTRFSIEPVYLPGITDTCMAITHAVQGDHCFLWVSDVEGSVHLFWSDGKFWEPGERGRRSLWKRSGLLERRYPVMRALASWSPGLPHVAVIGQACRDDRIVVSWYVSREDSAETKDAAELLSWGDVGSLLTHLPDGDPRQEWCIEALVADHIEETGHKPEGLRRFLRNPGTELASSALVAILEKGPAQRAGQALTLWNQTLIGTVHRRLESPGTQDYLGIIRWLRRLGESTRFRELTEAHPECAEDLRRSLDRNIQYARKWGVFGKTYASRESARSALEPLSHQTSEERQFDGLVYESLLFRQRVDPGEVLPSPASHDFAPWDLRYLEGEAGGERVEHVAVSWSDGGTVYRRLGTRPWQDLTAVEGAPGRDLGGRILLGACGAEQLAFLLSSPLPETQQEEERQGPPKLAQIQLRFLDRHAGLSAEPAVLDVAKLLPQGDEAAASEAVYCLHDLGEDRIAVGLEGTSGIARIGLLRITATGATGELEVLRQVEDTALTPIFPESKTLLRNPVWSLASYGVSADETVLLVGCGDGQIWKLHLRFHGQCYSWVEWKLVGRLGAPVTALACRPGIARESGPLRVFAGSADGTLVAFQALGDWRNDKEVYTTLWATQEQGGAVRSLHPLQSTLREEPKGSGSADGGAQHLVLAVTQPGMAVLILDQPEVERLEAHDANELRRLRAPGERLGRFSLRSIAFGSALLPDAEREDPSALARLLVAPAAGEPRLLTLHHPKFTPVRRNTFHKLLERWLESLHESGDRVQGHLLRQPETTYAASPELPSILVRWILPYRSTEESWEERVRLEGPGDEHGPARQWLPRHLRPLVDLDTAWKNGDPLNGLLRDALLAAHEVGDKALFKEILEAALSRANHQLFDEALKKNGLPFARGFEALMADLEKVKGVWEGSSGRLDSRMRITIAKSLLDGDTLWSLSAVPSTPPTPGTPAGPVELAMAARIRLVHRSLGKGDLLLALETLGAANLALLRLCRRLEREPEQDWSQAEAGKHFVRWEALRGFYQAVGDFAARMAHPKGNLGEVAAHEICRAYALGMLACPPAIAELAIWVAEADLPTDVGKRVLQQIDLLETLLGDRLPPLSKSLRELLDTAFAIRPEGSYKEALFFSPEPKPWIDDRLIGHGNVEMIRIRKPFDDVVVWLHDLARQLTDDAGSVELEKYEKLKEAIAPVRRDKDLLRHSRQFWHEALEDLGRMCRSSADLFAEPGTEEVLGVPLKPVRPELVLFSTALQAWCKRQRGNLQNLRGEYRIFEPISSIYDDALALVERAARRFRHGAAVQKNLVLGVLGHGLLELVDEHLLEVWEVAQALDPRRTWEQDDELERPATSTAAVFADYLLQRARKAEVIPKNLRSLQGLLSFTDKDGNRELTLGDLFARTSWALELGEIAGEPLDRRTYHFLHLTLEELLQNDHMHGAHGQPGEVRAERSPTGALVLHFVFHYRPDDENAAGRARFLSAHRLQTMMPPREEPRIPSHGTGLYLANLAAGAVGWKLEPEESEGAGILRFKLWCEREED